MTLRPVARAAETVTPRYPERRGDVLRRVSRLARGVGAVALASATMWIAGCDLFGTRMGGEPAGPFYAYFVCEGDSETENSLLDVPGTYQGSLCPESTGWATFDVVQTETLEVALDTGDGTALDATADVIDPTGVVVAEARAGDGFVAVEVTPGRWRIAVIPGPSASSYDPFDLTLQSPSD